MIQNLKDTVFETAGRVLLDGVRLGTAQLVGEGFSRIGKKMLGFKEESEEKEKKPTRAASLKDLMDGDK